MPKVCTITNMVQLSVAAYVSTSMRRAISLHGLIDGYDSTKIF